MDTVPKVGLIYLSYHSEPHLDDFLASLKTMDYPKEAVEVIIVDNPHPEYGLSVRAISEKFLPLSGKEIPRVTLLPQETNEGFATGNNAGVVRALELGCEYLIFHNDDGFFAPSGVSKLVQAMQKNPDIGMAQALILLYPDTEFVNSRGNSFHYLGFGFCDGYREKYADLTLPEISDISYASGAACIVSSKVIQAGGGWDPDYFMYHEDLDWSLRLRLLGFRVALIRDAVFYHKYQFSRSITKFFYQQRNRYAVLLLFYKIPTLILLLPMLLFIELGLWVFAFKNHWVQKQKQVYTYWAKKASWHLWLKKRKHIQSARVVSDRTLLRFSVPVILFQEAMMKNALLLYVGNPLMRIYYHLIRFIVWW